MGLGVSIRIRHGIYTRCCDTIATNGIAALHATLNAIEAVHSRHRLIALSGWQLDKIMPLPLITRILGDGGELIPKRI